jgi:prevent-host-death family protein
MREVALFDAKNRLSALIQEVLDSGEDVVITRHGQPTVRLTPFAAKPDAQDWAALHRRLTHDRDAFAAANPEAAKPVPWETLKEWLDE